MDFNQEGGTHAHGFGVGNALRYPRRLLPHLGEEPEEIGKRDSSGVQLEGLYPRGNCRVRAREKFVLEKGDPSKISMAPFPQ